MKTSLRKESELLAKHSLIYMFGNFLGRFVSLLLLPVYTRFLTPYDYGIKELIGLSTDVVGILIATSISAAIFRFYFEYDNLEDRNEVISSSIITIGGFGLLFLFVLSMATKTFSRIILDDAGLYYYFILSFISLWFQSLNNIAYNYMRAHQKSIQFLMANFFKMILAIGFNIYFVCFLKFGVLGILLTTLIVSVLMFFILLIPLVRKVGLKFSATKIKDMLRYGLPMVPAQFGSFIVNLSDRFFIKAYLSISDAGIYSLSYRFGSMPSNFISAPFNRTWQPRRFEIYKDPDSQRIFGKIFTYFIIIILFFSLSISVLTKEILIIIADEKFWPAYQTVPIIALATAIFSLQYHLDMGILISKKTKYLAYINFSNGLFILVLNFILIPKYGLFGAAYATLIAFVYKILLIHYFSRKFFKIYLEWNRIFKVLFASAVIFVLSNLINFSSVYYNFSIKVLLILFYPVILYALRLFSQYEKEKCIQYINNSWRTFQGLFKRKNKKVPNSC